MARSTYINLSDLKNIPVPAQTDSYTPVPQQDLWDTVCNTFQAGGYMLSNEQHTVHRKRPVFVSRIDVAADWLPTDGGGMKWTIAVMNSYDKSKSARIIFGGTVFVCSNGLIVADHVLRTKHTTHVWDRLPNLILNAYDQFEGECRKYIAHQETLKVKTTTTKDLADFTMTIARKGILPKAKALDFYEESVKPSFDYQTPNLCLWNLQAAYTHLAKEMNPVERPQRVLAFDRAMKETYAFA